MKIFKMMRGMQNRITRDKIIVATRLALFHNQPTKSYDFTQFPIPADVTFTRTTTATYWDASGVLQTAAIGEPRPYRLPTGGAILGLMIEEASTNSIRNNSMQGAIVGVIGSGGSMPTNWYFGAVSGCTREVVAIGVDDGIDYIDVRLFGTVNAASQILSMGTETSTSIATVQNDSWTLSTFCKLVAGSLTGMNIAQMMNEYSGVYLESNFSSYFTPTANNLSEQRRQFTSAMSNAAVTFVQPILLYSALANGLVVDVTLRIGMSQMEKKAAATSVIKTTTTAVTRAADNVKVSTISWFNALEGSFQVAGGLDGLGSNDVRVTVNVNNGISSNSITGFNALGDFRCEAVAANVVELNPLAPLVNIAKGIFKQAFNYKLNYMNQAVNGTLSDPDTTGVLPTGINQMIIGAAISTYYINGYIANINYWNTKLTDEQLLDLSSESLRSF